MEREEISLKRQMTSHSSNPSPSGARRRAPTPTSRYQSPHEDGGRECGWVGGVNWGHEKVGVWGESDAVTGSTGRPGK